MLPYEAIESRINLRVALMKEKYPRQWHARIDRNLQLLLQMLKDHNGKVPQGDVSEELRYGLPSLPIRKQGRMGAKSATRRRGSGRNGARR